MVHPPQNNKWAQKNKFSSPLEHRPDNSFLHHDGFISSNFRVVILITTLALEFNVLLLYKSVFIHVCDGVDLFAGGGGFTAGIRSHTERAQ